MSENKKTACPPLPRLALLGNPNSGKTTVFNGLTGARRKVANYPGVTVERYEGRAQSSPSPSPGGREGHEWIVLDLPGTYSLSAHTDDERIACRAVIDERADVVVAVADAANLERNLYLILQLREMGARLVVALNMIDTLERRGGRIDIPALEKAIEAPVIPTVGPRRKGLPELLDRAAGVLDAPAPAPPLRIEYGAVIEAAVARIEKAIAADTGLSEAIRERGLPVRWAALQLLGRDEAAASIVRESASAPESLFCEIERAIEAIQQASGQDIDVLLIGRRYAIAREITARVLTCCSGQIASRSDRIDAVLTHKLAGLPIFLLILWAIFQITFTIGHYPMDWIDAGFGWLGETVTGWMPQGMIRAAIHDAVFGGVAGVLVFLPQILLLFFCLGLLEDSGYMARAAFLIDRLMRKIGLHGKSLVPLLLGFGCNIPAIMATRSLENRRDRLVTILISPMMNCSARLTVHTLLAAAFFSPAAAGHALFSIYVLGALLAIASALLFRKTIFRGEPAPFVMEMPPYRVPAVRGILLQMFERAFEYLKKAGTVLLLFSIVIWALCHFPSSSQVAQTSSSVSASADQVGQTSRSASFSEDEEESTEAQALRRSFAGRLGETLAPLMRPLGLDNWKITVALISGIAAKEVIVATLGTVYSAQERADEALPPQAADSSSQLTTHNPQLATHNSQLANHNSPAAPADAESDTILRSRLAADPSLNPLRGYALMIFVLLYVPCITTMAVVRRETSSWRWPLIGIGYNTALAYLAALFVYQVGRLLGLGI